MNYRLSTHAREEAAARGIPLATIQRVMTSPDQIVETYDDRQVYQSKLIMNGTLYLVRVIVATTDPLLVVTVYRTTRIEKYWKP